MKRLLLILLCAIPCFGQVSFVGTVGGYTGYKLPYAEGSVEAKHRLGHFLVGAEVRGASGRKFDTGDGFHFGTRGIAAYSVHSFDFGGGYAWSKQWTSKYQKQAGRPVLYVRWHDSEQDIEGFWIFKGTDSRNGQQGAEFRYTTMLNKHWGFRVSGQVLDSYQTDQPKAKVAVGGAQVGLVYRLN